MARSKRARRRQSSAWNPELSSVMTQPSPVASRMRLRPSRTMVWSSTSSSRSAGEGRRRVHRDCRARPMPAPWVGPCQRQVHREAAAAARRVVDLQPAAEHVGALADPEQAETPFVLHSNGRGSRRRCRGWTARAPPPSWRISICTSVARGMPRHVGQCLLHHAVQRDRRALGHRRVLVAELHGDVDVHAARGVAGQPLDGGFQAQVVEHHRTQVGRDAAHRGHGVVDHLQHAGDAAVAALRAARRAQARQLHLQRRQALAEFVVQLARDAPALLLARLDHAGGEPAQIPRGDGPARAPAAGAA